MTKLVVLGFLKRKPLYGYEIKQLIEKEMGDWTNIAFGSIYFALSQLNKEGYIKQISTERQESRPAKIIYEITEKGEKEFTKLLLAVWKKNERHYFLIDIAFFFFNFIPKAKIKKYLRKKLFILKMALRHLKQHKKEEYSKKHLPAFAEAIFDHSLYYMKAEYLWLKDVMQKMERW